MKLFEDEKANARTVGVLTAVLVVIIVGLTVFWLLSSNIRTGSTPGAAVHTQVNSTAGTVFALAPIVAIVLVASLILAYVARFGSGGGGV